jgi:uncharacterized DUF497 family protein
MAALQFIWDAAKARANAAKHGIRSEEAETAFSDENAILLPDPDSARRATRSERGQYATQWKS